MPISFQRLEFQSTADPALAVAGVGHLDLEADPFLDALYEKKDEIERDLFLRLRDILNLKVDLVFYDITSIYFERREPVGKLRRHGKSRDGKPRDVQVLIGFVMVAGFPIASHIFAGNQKLDGDPSKLQYGVSITDACISWDETASLLTEAYQALPTPQAVA